MELNFYSNKKLDPAANDRMNFIRVDDVDFVYETFTTHYKRATGRVPRSGKPMFSKPRDLKDDRRFSMTDPNGNYFYVGTPITENFFRTIQSEEYAKNFGLAYDLLYSKMDLTVANHMMTKHLPQDLLSMAVEELDLAKVLMLAIDLKLQREKFVDEKLNTKLQELFEKNDTPPWKKLKNRLEEILN